MSCREYMEDYQSANGGYLLNPDAGSSEPCNFCTLGYSNQYLSSVSIDFGNRWRDFGLIWVYIVVNTFGAILFYKLFRVPRAKKGR